MTHVTKSLSLFLGVALEYVRRLAELYDSSAHDHISRSAALQSLRRIDGMMANRRGGDLETQAHVEHVRHTIRRALVNDVARAPGPG